MSCDGNAYVAAYNSFTWACESQWNTTRLLKFDVSTKAPVAELVEPGLVEELQLSANDGELIVGYDNYYDDDWYSRDNSWTRYDGKGPDLIRKEILATLPRADREPKFTLDNNGNLYTWQQVPAGGFYRLPYVVERVVDTLTAPTEGCGVPWALSLSEPSTFAATSGACASPGLMPMCIGAPQAAQLSILPSTTRWKPQKDTTTPFEIIFSGPSDLADAARWPVVTAEIKDPTGGDVPPPTLAFSVVNQAANEYKLTWSGPWLSNANPVSYLPRGNYNVVVKATTLDGTVVASEPYENVSLVEVKALKFQPIAGDAATMQNSELGGPGGGLAVLAEAATLGGAIRNKVRVVAELDPVVGQDVSVFLKSIDVDDPSGTRDAVDLENWPMDNARCDDCSGPADVPFWGRLNGSSTDIAWVSATGGSSAASTFEVSARQGDNYRVVASTEATWLNGVNAVQASDSGLVAHVHSGSIAEGSQSTEMLTVWRTLHLKWLPVGMAAHQDDLDIVDDWDSANDSRVVDNDAPFVEAMGGHPQPNDWIGARLTPCTLRTTEFEVERNTATEVFTAGGMLAAIEACVQAGIRTYRLQDDVLNNAATYQPRFGHAGRVLRTAYIRLSVQPVDSPTVPFVRHMSEEIHRALAAEFVNESTPGYWIAFFSVAFDAPTTLDYDPNGEGLVSLGQTTRDRVGSLAVWSVPFVETVRDLYESNPDAGYRRREEFEQITITHELLHGFFLRHRAAQDGTLMCPNLELQSGTNGDKLSAGNRLILRGRRFPAMNPIPEGSLPGDATACGF